MLASTVNVVKDKVFDCNGMFLGDINYSRSSGSIFIFQGRRLKLNIFKEKKILFRNAVRYA